MERKSNFFKDVWTSIKDFEKYEEFAADKLTRAITYILIITIIFTAIISLAYTYKFFKITQDIKDYIGENVEEISYKDGNLNVSAEEGKIVIENEESIIPIIIVDTSEEANKEEYMEKIKMYETGMLLLKDKAIVSNKLLSENEEIYYSNILDTELENKAELLELLEPSKLTNYYTMFYATMFIYMFFVYFASNIVDAVVLGVLGYLFARIMRLRLRYRATFNIGIHSLTLPIILNLVYIIVNTITGFNIEYFQWMYTSISYIYVVVAILMIKTEIINQKIQLMKLEKIQEKATNEEKEKEEEKDESKEKEKQKKKEEKEDKKEEKEPKGEQPEGSNA